MRQIAIEPVLKANCLISWAGKAILCDPEGRALGFFSPLAERPRAEDLQLEPHLSPAEIQELRKNRTGKPLGEILARLGIE